MRLETARWTQQQQLWRPQQRSTPSWRRRRQCDKEKCQSFDRYCKSWNTIRDIPHTDGTYQRTNPDGAGSPGGPPGSTLHQDIYQQDGDYIKDIEVNDLRNRYTLTKGATQKMVIISFTCYYSPLILQSRISFFALPFPLRHGFVKMGIRIMLEKIV